MRLVCWCICQALGLFEPCVWVQVCVCVCFGEGAEGKGTSDMGGAGWPAQWPVCSAAAGGSERPPPTQSAGRRPTGDGVSGTRWDFSRGCPAQGRPGNLRNTLEWAAKYNFFSVILGGISQLVSQFYCMSCWFAVWFLSAVVQLWWSRGKLTPFQLLWAVKQR